MKPPLFRRLRGLSLALLTAAVAATTLTCTSPTASAASSSGPVKGAGSGRCLDVSGASQANGADLVMWTCNGQTNQTWTVTSAGELRVYGTAKCLDVASHDTSSPARVQTYGCTGNSNQKWTISGKTIRGVESGLCLDVSGGRSDNGAPVQLYTCNGSSAQSWTISGSATTTPSTGTTWTQDFREDFNSSLDTNRWERYGYGYQPIGSGAMGAYNLDDTFTRNGSLILRTEYKNGKWTSGGTSTRTSFAASMGKWEVRARFPKGDGLGYCFLLWPADNSWPPELNFAEGQAGNPVVSGTYHWSPQNLFTQVQTNVDLQSWHTYGVIVQKGLITFTIDGKTWGTIKNDQVTDKKMYLALQAGAMDPNGSSAWWAQTVAGGVPNSKTPATMDIEVDSAVHYHS